MVLGLLIVVSRTSILFVCKTRHCKSCRRAAKGLFN